MENQINNLDQMLDRIEEAAVEKGRIYLGGVIDRIGRRSFGPLLLLAGILVLMPIIGDIPGVPTVLGIFVILVCIQLLMRRQHFWLPQWLQKRSVKPENLYKAVNWSRRPARVLDRILRPRLRFFLRGWGIRTIALVCMGVAIVSPVMELIPFSANLAGAAYVVFGLSLIANDGLFALLAFMVTATIPAILLLNIV